MLERRLVVATLCVAACLCAVSPSYGASRDSLFEDDEKEAPAEKQQASPASQEKKPSREAAPSREALFGEDEAEPKLKADQGWKGFAQLEAARTYASPGHWSKGRVLVDLARAGQFSGTVKWKIEGLAYYDPIYANSGFYPEPVRRDQRAEFILRENYLDVAAGDWDFRLGRQHVVWGEMVGLFFADVVSARDMREFLLPEFELLRTPQWAARAEWFGKDTHAELVWIPWPSFDNIGKPGADFFPTPLPGPGGIALNNEQHPARDLAHTNYGLRLSALKAGWDVSAFAYHSQDINATFYREPITGPVFVYTPRHDPINQTGATVAKDFDFAVFKGEVVYTDGRKYTVARVTEPDGLVKQNTLDYALGLDFSLPAEARLNLQFFQRVFFDHDPDTLLDRFYSGAAILVNGKLAPKLEGQLLLIHSLKSGDSLFRPRVSWNFEKNWRLMLGADVFNGPATGLFGRFDNQDRVYSELRYTF